MKSVTVTKKITINLGNYSNIVAEATVEYEPWDGELYEDAIVEAHALVAKTLMLSASGVLEDLLEPARSYWHKVIVGTLKAEGENAHQ